MEWLIIIVLYLSGIYNAFLSSVIHNISFEELNKSIQSDSDTAKLIQKIKARSESASNPFFIFEMLSYTFICLCLGISIIGLFLWNILHSGIWFSWMILSLSSFVFITLTLIIRSIAVSLGKRFASRAVQKNLPFIRFFYTIAKPVISLIIFFDEKIAGKDNAEASREELSALVESAREDGSLDAGEYRILKNMMNFSDVLVSDVMTPRTVVFTCEADKTVGEIIDLPELRMYSRFPVWEGESIDSGVIGYVLSKDVLHAALAGNTDMKLRSMVREVYFIPENAELDNALERFLQRRQHLFVVVDEYGGVEGLLTMEDVLETILGAEIVDEADKVVDLREFAKQKRDRRVASLIAQS
ncbi:MAG: hypothetical protein QG635_1115 [Bacteroidota bacterium]|nr:hypothetical protein [Bacteroidota bacterium]